MCLFLLQIYLPFIGIMNGEMIAQALANEANTVFKDNTRKVFPRQWAYPEPHYDV